MEQDFSWHRNKAPGYRLAKLFRLSAAYLAPKTRKLGLKRAWIGPLLAVLEEPGQSQDAISHNLCIDQAATARSMFELEGQGYLMRREDPKDRRQKLVQPTPKAYELSAGLDKVLKSHNQALFKGFSPKRRQEALEILDLMIANLKAALSQGEAVLPAKAEPE